MERLQLEIEFVTPCFLGGVRQQAEWRAASVRGQLRWWFRAVAGGATAGDLGEVKRLEAEIFGSTEARSPLQVRALGMPASVAAESLHTWGRPLGDEALADEWGVRRGTPEWREATSRLRMQWPVNPLLYLGYGCLAPAGGGQARLSRSCFLPAQKASLRLTWRRPRGGGAGSELWDAAFWCWLNLGGLGTRSRRGFGSLREVGGALPGREAFVGETKKRLSLLAQESASGALAHWTYFTRDSRVFVASVHSTSWDEAMVRAGAWLMAFRRRYGYPEDGRTLGTTPLANRDYVWAGPRRQPSGGVPDRAGFGLPLPFGDQIVAWEENGKERRRASPLLLHIAHLKEGFFAVFTYLPAPLVPNGQVIRFKGLPRPAAPPSPEQGSIVAHFLGDLARKKLVEKVL